MPKQTQKLCSLTVLPELSRTQT